MRKISASRSPQRDPVGPPVQDLCMRFSCAYLRVRISASGSRATTCVRSLYADLLRKISLPGCLHQDPVGQLVQDLCVMTSCASCLRSPQQNPVRLVYEDLLRKIDLLSRTAQDLCMGLWGSLADLSVSMPPPHNPPGALAQDLYLCTRISCPRSLSQDLCIRISSGP